MGSRGVDRAARQAGVGTLRRVTTVRRLDARIRALGTRLDEVSGAQEIVVERMAAQIDEIHRGDHAPAVSGRPLIAPPHPQGTTTCRTASPPASRSKPAPTSSSASLPLSSRSTGSSPARCSAMNRGTSRPGTHEPR